ncbi:MAG: SRPBCC family protein [Actinobacteria bacterium]|uniref:Unannotated protein n=1 Tax=freshwater metagenome TaxID=449393 RepID=A0A6J7CMS3_9ZZZZ|nr:SRPBCC family protein [Actinomycetota bacterium]
MFKLKNNHVAISINIDAPLEEVWNSLAQWEKQSDWMLQTNVWVTSEVTEGIGTQISAFTGISRLGVLDTMEVTRWEPPYLCDVIHTGKIIKGTGRFQLRALSPSHTAFDWSEEVYAPPIIFIFIKPALYLGVRISLARFARTFHS